MNYEIRGTTPKDGAQVIEIFQQGIDGGNSIFDQSAPTWEDWDQKFFNTCRFVTCNF